MLGAVGDDLVGMGIASAILALTFPDEYGVIADIGLEGDLWHQERIVLDCGLQEIS